MPSPRPLPLSCPSGWLRSVSKASVYRAAPERRQLKVTTEPTGSVLVPGRGWAAVSSCPSLLRRPRAPPPMRPEAADRPFQALCLASTSAQHLILQDLGQLPPGVPSSSQPHKAGAAFQSVS